MISRYKKGDWLALCDMCGQRYYASKLRQRWDGLMVCNKDWETRHPQEFVRAKEDNQTVPWTRPESTSYIFGDIFGYIDPTYFEEFYVIMEI